MQSKSLFPSGSEPLGVRVPSAIAKKDIGLGDWIKRATTPSGSGRAADVSVVPRL